MMKIELLAITASLALAGLMSASVSHSDARRTSNVAEFSHSSSSLPLMAREKEPGDDRGHDGREHHRRGRRDGRGDDGRGHHFA